MVAVIGDGSLTAGLAFEGLNQAGHLKKDICVILNDNEMSISKNVGALSSFLSRKITGRFATKVKKEVESFIKTIPMIGDRLMWIAKRAEDSLIAFLTPGMIFEGLGFHYIGPVDGHDVGALISTLKDIDEVKGPVLLHVLTKKGKGYAPAELDPASFHGVGPFDAVTGRPRKPSVPSYTSVFSSTLLELARWFRWLPSPPPCLRARTLKTAEKFLRFLMLALPTARDNVCRRLAKRALCR